MTKEEAVNKAIEIEFGLGNNRSIREHNSSLVKIAEHVYDLLHPSLPSNLDEATEEYAYNNWEDNDYHTGASEGLPFDAIGHTKKCFKAGAEWMAEQGVSMEYEVEDKCLGLGYGSLPGLDPIIILPDYFKPSDKVIIQIRKKD